MLETLNQVRWSAFDGATIQGRPVDAWMRELPADDGEQTSGVLTEALFGDDPWQTPRVSPLAEALLPFLIEIIESDGVHFKAGAIDLIGSFMNSAPEYVDAYEPDPRVTARELHEAYWRWSRTQSQVLKLVPVLLDLLAGEAQWTADAAAAQHVLGGAVGQAMAFAPTVTDSASMLRMAKALAPWLTQRERVRWIVALVESALKSRGDLPQQTELRESVHSLLAPAEGRALSEPCIEQLFLFLGPREREFLQELL